MVWSVNEAVVRSDPAYQATLNVIRPPIVLGVATLLHMPKYVNLCANDRKKNKQTNKAIIIILENSSSIQRQMRNNMRSKELWVICPYA